MTSQRATALIVAAAFVALVAIRHGFRGVRVSV
jgi:hypothetical protein